MTELYTVSNGNIVFAADVDQLANWINDLVWVNVKYHGAVGDGVTNDDTPLTNGMAALPTTGGVLYFPPNCNCLTSTGLDFTSYTNARVLGGGWSSGMKLANGANKYLIRNGTNPQVGMHISGLRLDCNSANQTAASGGINGYKWRRGLIDFVDIVNPWQAGIYLLGDVGDFGYQNRIDHCWISGGSNVTSGTNAWGQALHIENVDENCSIANCHLENNGNFNDTTFGCHIYDKNGLSSFIGNSLVNGYIGFKLDGLQDRIIGNAFDGNGGCCVQCNGSASGTIIEGNTILNPGYRATGGSANSVNAIYLAAPRCQVIGNEFQSAAGSFPYTNSFVQIDTGATDFVVGPNIYDIPTGSGTVTPVIFVSGRPARGRLYQGGGFNAVSSAASFVIENHGTATISASTSVVVNRSEEHTSELQSHS